MKKYCFNCKHIKVNIKDLATARLVPSTKIQIRCNKSNKGILRNNNINNNCFEPSP